MKRLIVSIILVMALAGPAAADIDVTFETVDEVELRWVSASFDSRHELRVRGIPQGQTEPADVVTVIYPREEDRMTAASCERKGLMAISRPGRYLLQITAENPNGSRERLLGCRLVRR